MRILVLGGCGAMGIETVRDLVQTSSFDEITIVDINPERLHNVITQLRDRRLKGISLDIRYASELIQHMKGSTVVANCTPYHYGVIAAEAAIAAKVNYLDLGGLYNTPKQLTLDEKAKRAGIAVVLGCGATPGVTNLMARQATNELDRVDEVHIAFASFRDLAPSPGLLDTILDEFSPDTVRFFFRQGKFVEVPAFSGAQVVSFAKPVGRQTTYYVPHSEVHTIPRFIKGVKVVDVRGTWRPDIMEALRVFARFNLLRNNPVPVKGVSIGPREFLRAHLLRSNGMDEKGEWAFYLNVNVLGKKSGRRREITYNSSHPSMKVWGRSATARMTGISASIGAQFLARGDVMVQGVLAPEACFDPGPFFSELNRRGVKIHRSG